MIHLFKHSKGRNKGKYDIALVVKRRVIVFSNQGYSRKSGAVNAIKTMAKDFNCSHCYFQDDTLPSPSVFYFSLDSKPLETIHKPHKPYLPK